jgi:hypothetical protein
MVRLAWGALTGAVGGERQGQCGGKFSPPRTSMARIHLLGSPDGSSSPAPHGETVNAALL